MNYDRHSQKRMLSELSLDTGGHALSFADPESFVRGAQNLIKALFVIDEIRKDTNSTKSGSPQARQRNAILMAFRWQADNGPTLDVGSVAL